MWTWSARQSKARVVLEVADMLCSVGGGPGVSGGAGFGVLERILGHGARGGGRNS